MPRFYKGIGVGTFLHATDLRATGISPRAPGVGYTPNALLHHIARGTTVSPCISLTRSFGVAEMYAREASRAFPTAAVSAFVYGIEINNPPPVGMTIYDPVQQITSLHPDPLAQISYHHDGDMNFLLGVVNPMLMSAYLNTPVRQPGHSTGTAGGTARPANLSLELEALVRALRDAEVMVIGTIPATCVVERHDVF